MAKYIFYAGSIEGLMEDIELFARNYPCARRRVLKYIALNLVSKHPVRGIKPSVWE